ncbi:PREDICTED: peroxisomal (S)-2-hydroxy-acid oxidase GLO4-like isoform X2 [Tarenaya hassleriana]|uniref:peroxisomal (S)-2-hydroxy-acid oxidase GLO4-like isoform X2 n=1 Tax=Tarenaya hassleriana TaxID=28532 RepID=UPI00053C7A12|nr:PREDICTED: peroxisomal (S)-2-hydroxy-acid oxidase GLO4-like isoform X2 [Tarenaya hassleriana]
MESSSSSVSGFAPPGEGGIWVPISRPMADETVNVNEFQQLAKKILPKMHYDFYAGGSEDQHTLKENIEAFHRITLRPRVLTDVSRIDMSVSILGYRISAPVMIAPTARHKLAHPQGEIATARAAASSKTIMIVSYMSTCTVEEIAASCNAVRFLQLYVFKKRDITARMVKRAENSGYKAIVLTVDVPRLGRREADIKNRMISRQLENFKGSISTENKGSGIEALTSNLFDASVSWKDIEWLRSVTKLPILIKGILTSDDAVKAVEARVDGIIVSNHGGRQLDYTPATITVLEEVVHAVKGKIPILVDGGIRRGTDVFKALAFGAQAVLIGRPVIFGLAAKGEDGAKQVIEMLKNELETTMALSGCPTIKDITRSHVRTEHETLLQSML